jgi:hypothetical protein
MQGSVREGGRVNLTTMIASNWQAMVSLTGAFIAGTFFMGTLSGFVGLPERHDADIKSLDDRITPIEHYVDDIKVLVCVETKIALEEDPRECVQ